MPGALQPADEIVLAEAVDVLAYEIFKEFYRYDPAGFVVDCLDWDRADSRPIGYQLEGLENLIKYGRESTRGPRGIGKTTPAAWACLWFALTRDGIDWKSATTATAFGQLKRYLWPEIHKWHRLVRWSKIGRGQLVTGRELLDMAIQLSTGDAFAVASNDPDRIEGLHGDSVLAIIDEGKGVPEATYDAVEGWFSGSGPDVPGEAFVLNYSTPGEPQGRFYAIQSRKRGYEDWHVRHVTRAEAIAAGRMSEDWANKRKRQWGESDPRYLRHVEGEFSSDEDAVIPLDWVEAAVERWHELAGKDGKIEVVGQATSLGVDVGGSSGGTADTVLAPRFGTVVPRLEVFENLDEMRLAGKVVAFIDADGGTAVIDVIGIGAGVVSRVREQKRTVLGFHAAESAGNLTDQASGNLKFANRRAAAWWGMRERLHPELGDDIALPPDDELIGDLTTPRKSETSTGRIIIESKEDVKERLGASVTLDRADAVIHAFFLEALKTLEAPKVRRGRVRVLGRDS